MLRQPSSAPQCEQLEVDESRMPDTRRDEASATDVPGRVGPSAASAAAQAHNGGALMYLDDYMAVPSQFCERGDRRRGLGGTPGESLGIHADVGAHNCPIPAR